MKFRKIHLELLNDYSEHWNKPSRRVTDKNWPYYKLWRMWAMTDADDFVCLGHIIKQKHVKTREVKYSINLIKLDFKFDLGHHEFDKDTKNYPGRVNWLREGIDKKKDKRQYENYKTLKEAYNALKQRFIDNVLLIIKP